MGSRAWLFKTNQPIGEQGQAIHFQMQFTQKLILSNDFAVIQWTILCYKNRMTTRVITSWGLPVTPLTTSTSAMCCLKEIMLILKMMKSHSRESYDK